jgi:hypothetical protein
VTIHTFQQHLLLNKIDATAKPGNYLQNTLRMLSATISALTNADPCPLITNH